MGEYAQILVEGPDCSGKSTLVNRLKNELRWDAKSLHHHEGDQFLRYLREYAMPERIIFDRGHVSETVYAMLWRGGTPFSQAEKDVLDSIVRQRMVTVLALPEPPVLRERYLSRAYPQQIKLNELEEAGREFDAYFQGLKPMFIYRSSDYDELERLVKDVRQVVRNTVR